MFLLILYGHCQAVHTSLLYSWDWHILAMLLLKSDTATSLNVATWFSRCWVTLFASQTAQLTKTLNGYESKHNYSIFISLTEFKMFWIEVSDCFSHLFSNPTYIYIYNDNNKINYWFFPICIYLRHTGYEIPTDLFLLNPIN